MMPYENIEGAGHVFGSQLDMMLERCEVYLDRRLKEDAALLAESDEDDDGDDIAEAS